MDQAISADILTVLGFLARQPSAVYADAFNLDAEIRELVELWRPETVQA